MRIIIVKRANPERSNPFGRCWFLTKNAMRAFIAICLLGTRWLWSEFGRAALCFGCVYLGALSTVLLPSILLLATQGMSLSPLTALPIAVYVVDVRAYKRWKAAGQAQLGIRMLRACSDGITWWCWWRSSNHVQ